MKAHKTIKALSIVILLALAVVNVFVFVNGLKLQGEIAHFERETARIDRENQDYRELFYERNSLKYAASKAAELNFINRAEPYYLVKPGFARNR